MTASLSELKELLIQQGPISLIDIAHHLHKDPLVIRDMLSHWERKGKVRLTMVNIACQSHCCGCGTGPAEMYEWLDFTPPPVV